jgi:glycosyltransferase involved in cell wall biosynthesis
MRIAIITHDIYPGDGQGRVNFELARFLLDRGIKVDLLADRIDETLLDHDAKWVSLHPGGRSINLLRVWRFKQLANRYLDAHPNRYDIILACGVVLDRAHTVNVAHFVHGTWAKSPYHSSRQHRGWRRWYYQLYTWLNLRWEQSTLAVAEAIVAVSDKVRNDLIELGLSPDRIRVIPNGVDTKEFAPGPGNRTEFGLPPASPLALFVGDIQSPRKNLETALEALAKVPDLHLAVAGKVKGSPYPALAADLGVADRTHFMGFQHDIPALMRSADVFVLPSHQDPFGLVVTEAMASGLPVIVSRSVGASCLVTPEVGVIIDPADDSTLLAQAFADLAGNPARRRRMGKAARRAALEVSWSRMSERYLNLFYSLSEAST